MKNLKERPTISTENKSKIMSKGNGITSIFERVFNRSHEESDKDSTTPGNGNETESGKKISVYAEDHSSQFGTVKVLGTVKTYGPEKEEAETVDEERNEELMNDEYDSPSPVEVEEAVTDPEVPQPALEAYPFQTEPGLEGPPYTYIPSAESMEAETHIPSVEKMESETHIPSAESMESETQENEAESDTPDIEEVETAMPSSEVIEMQTPSTEVMETQQKTKESEFKNGDHYEHNVEIDQNGSEETAGSHDSEESSFVFSRDDLNRIDSPLEFVKELKKQKPRPERFLKRLKHEQTLEQLQVELVKLQRSVVKNGERVIVIFEGMDLAGKYGTIRKFTKYMDPRTVKVVSLRKRTNDEKEQWYFQRYMDHLPGKGEMVFFNRSWYERGFVEPIHGECTDHEYGQFLSQTPDFEYMLSEHGVKIIKIWLAVSADEHEKRYAEQIENPLMNAGEVLFDKENLELWSEASKYRNIMFSWTDKSFSPWTVISADKKKRMRLEAMKHVLSLLEYEGKKEANVGLTPDATIVRRFHRSMIKEMD